MIVSAERDKHASEVAMITQEAKSTLLPSNPEFTALFTEMDDYTRQIEECCMEWRAGRVRPFWQTLIEPKFGRSTSFSIACSQRF